MTSSTARIESLWRHPIKGFTPESLKQVFLEAGGYFPNDRMFAIEDGPSGFDPDEPKHISKMRFAVLARSAKIAKFETMYLDDSQELEIFERDENCICRFDMSSDEGFEDLSDWLTGRLGDEFSGPLKVIVAPKDHRFVDHFTAGFVSLINSNSVGALAAASQTEIGFQRFRPNIVFSADAWIEDNWINGQRLKIGDTELEILAPTVRCKATHANPKTARYDVDTVPLLIQHFERRTMGVYAKIVTTGSIAVGDKLEVLSAIDETGQTYAEALKLAAQKLAKANVEGPVRDARRLLELAADMSPTQLIADENALISPSITDKFEDFIQRRICGEPVSRIAGKREFWGLEFGISSDVLDPRPDTETLVELVLSEWKTDYIDILDLGTGSGCILLSILSEKLSAQGLGLDQSQQALAVAVKNAEKLGLKQRARFQHSNWFDALTSEQKFDVIVSNPPYIPSSDIEALDIDVKKYDPLSALDGGEDGYDDYRRIISKAKVHLKKNGLIAFEVGFDQAEKVCELLENEKFIHINVRKDLSGIKRCVYGYASSV